MLRVRRIYEPPAAEDGCRVLVDRIWPRGMTRERARLDLWCKDVAPSSELRRWYGHDPERFAEFRRRYLAELAQPDHQPAVDQLAELVTRRTVTLLTATRKLDASGASVLRTRVESACSSGDGGGER